MIKIDAFKQPMRYLMEATFGLSGESDGAYMDTGRSGLFGLVEGMEAQVASMAADGSQDTIASHCNHLLYHLRLFHAYELGQKPQSDWPASWRLREVDEASWSHLKDELRAAYEVVMTDLQAREDWPQPVVHGWMELLAHCAYHIGVVDKQRHLVGV